MSPRPTVRITRRYPAERAAALAGAALDVFADEPHFLAP